MPRAVSGSGYAAEVCCRDMAHAFDSCTDNEGYGSLLSVEGWNGNNIGIGVDLPEINLCPWCGAAANFKWEKIHV